MEAKEETTHHKPCFCSKGWALMFPCPREVKTSRKDLQALFLEPWGLKFRSLTPKITPAHSQEANPLSLHACACRSGYAHAYKECWTFILWCFQAFFEMILRRHWSWMGTLNIMHDIYEIYELRMHVLHEYLLWTWWIVYVPWRLRTWILVEPWHVIHDEYMLYIMFIWWLWSMHHVLFVNYECDDVWIDYMP